MPNEPVANDEIENVLGMIDGKPSKARAIVLRKNGIKTRYYAHRNGQSTHSNVQLAANAINALFTDGKSIQEVDILTAGTGSPDQLIPSHASMVHGALGTSKEMELMSATGTCCSSVQAMKYAYMAIAAGMAGNAVCSGSEKISSWLHSNRFKGEVENLNALEENPYIAFEKDFLRWMLSDGAAAALLQAEQDTNRLNYRIDWLETTSYANELETCMYAGAVKNEDGSLSGWNDMTAEQWANDSVFAVKQDTRLLSDNIVQKGGAFLKSLMQKHNLTADAVDYFLPHMSSEFFRQSIADNLKSIGLPIPEEKWFYNLPRVGNVGSASAFLMMEELFNSGKLKKGDRILVMVPESARFAYAYIYLTVV